MTAIQRPLHEFIADDLRQKIDDGGLAVGTRLPSEQRLCELFGASRGTVRAAVARLRREGLVVGGQGQRPTVREVVAAQSFDNFMSFTTWAESTGRTPGQRTIEIARRGATAVVARALGTAEGDLVVDVLRLRTLDGEPAMIERSSFIESVGQALFDFDADSGSIYAHLMAQGADLHAGRHTIDAVGAGEVDARHLGVDLGAPLLRERRRVTNRHGSPIEYAEDRYRPDRVSFTIDNHQSGPSSIQPDLRIVKEIS